MQSSSSTEEVKKKMKWDPKVGFKIPYGPYNQYNLLTCKTEVNGREFKSMYLLQRRSKSATQCRAFLIIMYKVLILS